jgi:hypothetical protein
MRCVYNLNKKQFGLWAPPGKRRKPVPLRRKQSRDRQGAVCERLKIVGLRKKAKIY